MALQPLLLGKAVGYAVWFPVLLLLPCFGFVWKWYRANKGMDYEEAAP